MGFCGCSLRATRIFAAIFSLIQGGAWLGLAIAGLGLYNCNVTPQLSDSLNFDNPLQSIVEFFSDVLYITYFYNVNCTEVELPNLTYTDPINQASITLQWDTDTQAQVVRTYSWMVTYIVLSSLWIASSIVLLLLAVGNKKGKSIAICHYPWIIVMAAVTVADIVATVTYFLDMGDMQGAKALLKFMGVQGVDEVPPGIIPDSNDILTTIPAITMGIIFARFFILWIINFTLIIFVIMAANDVAKEESKSTGWQHADVTPRTVGNERPIPNQPQALTNDQQRHVHYQGQEQPANPRRPESLSHSQSSHSPNYYQGQENFEYPVRPLSPIYHQTQENFEYPVRPLSPSYPQRQESFSYADGQRPFSYTKPSQPFVYPARGGAQSQQQPLTYPAQGYTQPRESSSYQNQEQRIQNQQLGSVNPAFEGDVQKPRLGPPTAPKTYQGGVDANNQSSIIRRESLENRKRAPTELRSQLPWSYYQPRDDPVNVKQPNIREEDEDLPPIPVPDYTLHFPKRPRGDNPLQSPPRDSTMTKNKNDVLY